MEIYPKGASIIRGFMQVLGLQQKDTLSETYSYWKPIVT